MLNVNVVGARGNVAAMSVINTEPKVEVRAWRTATVASTVSGWFFTSIPYG